MRSPHLKLALCLSVAAAVGYPSGPAPADAKPAKHRAKKPRIAADPDWGSAPSARYGALGKTACLAELKRRQVAFVEVEQARGVLAPIRLTGPLAGIAYHTEAPALDRSKSPHEIMDCRLALALHDFGPVLVKFGVTEAIIFSAWRPPAKSWPAEKSATRHPGGLAIDLKKLVMKPPAATPATVTTEKTSAKPRTDLVVDRDWTPARDQAPCKGPVKPDNAEARALRAIFCEADAQRLFTTMLSPNYNKAHENHFHLEITPGVTWRLVL